LFGQDVAMSAVGVVGLGNIGGALPANLFEAD
jgi:hypothetical protein